MSTAKKPAVLPPWQNKDLKDIKGEVWKPIPGVEDYGMISNYGSLKRLAFEQMNKQGQTIPYKERIQSQKIIAYNNRFVKDRTGHLSARIQVQKKCHYISIGRMVYHCFVASFDLSDHSIFITYKDNDRLNTRPDNLMKTDISGLIIHSMEAGRRDMHFGHNATNQAIFSERGRKITRKPVHQYDMQGNYIATHESLTAAAGSLPNRQRYQGNEYREELNLRWMDFHNRQYDPQRAVS